MSEEAPVETASHDDTAAPSPAPEVEANALQADVDTSATETPEEPKKVNKVQERINQLTREKHETRQENADLRARLDKLEAGPAVKAPDLVAPDPDKFDTDQEYQTANAQYYADVSLKATDDRLAVENQETERNTRQQTIETKKKAFDENVTSKRENFQDFEDVAYGHKFMDMDLAEQIFEMDKGPEVAYHLGAHLDEAARIFALNPVQRARELTKLEFQVEALKPKVVSGAPDPITPLGNSEAVDTAGDNGENIKSADEWREWRNKQLNG